MKAATLLRLVAVVGALALATEARAQGDMDFLTTAVPPNVMIQFDTSGSMTTVVLPPEYISLRGTAGASQNWMNDRNVAANEPAAAYSTSYYRNTSGNEDYRPTCTIYRASGTRWSRCQSIRMNNSTPTPAQTGSTSCATDLDSESANWLDSGDQIRCWNMPGGCTNVPAGFGCSHTASRRRYTTSTAYTNQPYTTITLPDWSYTNTTQFPPNYLWWVANQIYLGATPVPVIPQDRNAAAKEAVKLLVDATNPDGQTAKVKFGLARYHSSNNGGYVVVPPALDNKSALMTAIDAMPASGSTPLSETLVDVGRFFAGSQNLGTYPTYNRDLNGNTGGTVPASPIENGCEKNFVIVVTDGLPTRDCNDHHGTAFMSSIGNYDGLGPDTLSNPCSDSTQQGETTWLDDVAKYLHDNDLRPDMIGLQNVFTYTVGFNVDASLLQTTANLGAGRYYNTSNASDLADSLIQAVMEILQRNTSFSSATVPSTRTAFGDGFYTAYFLPGGNKGVWRGHLEAYRLSPSLLVLDKDGQVALDPVTNEFVEPRNPFWDAEETLLAQYNARTLYATRGGVRTPFQASDPNNAAQLGVTYAEESLYPHYLNDPNLINSAEELADAIVNFAHGYDAFDENEDGNTADPREWVFGDVFHSSPVAVGPAMPFLRNEQGYGPASDANSFMGRYGLRQRVLYVGANDGMLHAFAAGSFQDPDPNTPGDEYYSAGDGHELFGYIPGFLLNRIKYLPQLHTGKQFFVDGNGSAADVFIDYNGNGIKEGSDWTTALVMPARQGGEGMIALDVTDPNASTGNHGPYPRLMWELTHSGLGETWSRPIITRLKMRATSGTGDRCGQNDGDGDCVEQWVAIFGAGYRAEGDPNLAQYTNDPNAPTYTTKGRGVYIVRIADGSVLARLSQNQSDPIFSKMKYAIPAEPAVLDTNFDGFADVIYIGDIGGQLWKWDVSAVGQLSGGVVPTSVWPANVIFSSPPVTVAGGRLHYHSIFQGAAAAYVSNILTLSFASGERTDMGYIGESDPNNPTSLIGKYDDNNRFWVLKDEVPTGTGAFPSNLPVMEAGASGSTGHPTLTDITDLAQDNNLADAGYFFRVQDGEKFITNHLIFGGQALTLSYLPAELNEIDPEVDPGEELTCTISGQTNQWKWNLATGGGELPDPTDTNATVRTLVLGNGAPTDPRLTISKDTNGQMVIKITAQTSTGAIANPTPPPNALDLVDLIYWRQNF